MKNTFVTALLSQLDAWSAFARQTTSNDRVFILRDYANKGHRREIEKAFQDGKNNATEEVGVTAKEYYDKNYTE